MAKKEGGLSSKEILQEIIKIIAEYDTKLTVRQIYYQLVSKHIIENVKAQYNRVSKILVKARHDGDVDWEAIEDRTRAPAGGDVKEDTPDDHFNSALNYMKNCWKYFKLPFWKGQPKYVEVWFEKQALQGIFEQETENFHVVQLACKGYSSHTMGYALKERVNEIMSERPEIEEIHIIYFGDLDPSGLDIYRFIQDMSIRFGLHIEFERVAITSEQVRQYRIPPMMAKTSDSRYGKFVAEHGTDVVELDALNPNVLQELIRRNISKYFDPEIRADIVKQQERMQKEIKKMVEDYMEKRG